MGTTNRWGAKYKREHTHGSLNNIIDNPVNNQSSLKYLELKMLYLQ